MPSTTAPGPPSCCALATAHLKCTCVKHDIPGNQPAQSHTCPRHAWPNCTWTSEKLHTSPSTLQCTHLTNTCVTQDCLRSAVALASEQACTELPESTTPAYSSLPIRSSMNPCLFGSAGPFAILRQNRTRQSREARQHDNSLLIKVVPRVAHRSQHTCSAHVSSTASRASSKHSAFKLLS